MITEKKQFNNKVDADFKDRVDEHLTEVNAHSLSANILVQKSVSYALDYYDTNGKYPWQ